MICSRGIRLLITFFFKRGAVSFILMGVLFLFFSRGVEAATVSLSTANDSGTGSLRTGITTINSTGDAANTVNSNSNYSVALESTLPTLNFATTFALVPFDISGSLDFNMGAVALTFNQSDTATFSGNIKGTGASVVKSGTNTLTMTGTSTYTGGTTINAGTLSISDDANLGNTVGGVIFGGGTLEVNISDYKPTARAFTMTGNGTLKVDSNAMTISTNMTGAGTLTKLGNGDLILTGTNTNSGMITVSVGSLQGDTDSLKADIFDSTTVTFAQTTDGTYSKNITGTGVLIKTGAGVLTMTGTNSYSGGTTLSAGGLLGNAAAIQGDIASSGTVTFNQAAAGTYAGVMSGGGSVTKTGAGTLTFSGANTYSGGTTVSAGTLQGTTSSLTGNIVNNSGVIFNQTTTGSYSGNISGTGTLTKLGTGIANLRGTNSYTGGTTVTAGTLQGTTSALQGAITNNAAVVFDQDTDGTYAGTMTTTAGTPTLGKIGTGKVSLSGNVTVNATTVTTGGLFVNNTLTSPTVTVASGGDLGGNGTIVGIVTNNGIVSPGASIGELTITGNYIHQDGATLSNEITPTTTDLLTVSGTFIINGGGTSIIPLNSSTRFLPTTTYTIAQATGGVVNQFSTLSISSPSPLFSAGYTYGANNIQVTVTIAPFASVVKGGNPGAVATYIDGFSPAAGSDLDFVISQLQLLSLVDLKDALNQLQPANYKGLIIAQENNSTVVQSAVWNRLEERYKTECSRERVCPKRFSVWSDGYGDFLSFRGKKFFNGFDARTLGVLLGGDYAFCHGIMMGFFGGYTHSDLSWKSDVGRGDIDSYYAGIYGGWHRKRGFLNASVHGASSRNKASRKMHFLLLDRKARTTHHGENYQAHIDGGVIFCRKDLELRPFASLDYLWLHQDGFSERRAGSLNLKVGESDYTMLRSELGFKLANCWWIDECTQVIPDFKLSWIYEGRFKDTNYSAQFKESGGSFSSRGLHPDVHMIAPGFGVTTLFAEGNCSLSLRYDGEFGEDYHDNRGQFEFIYRF